MVLSFMIGSFSDWVIVVDWFTAKMQTNVTIHKPYLLKKDQRKTPPSQKAFSPGFVLEVQLLL
jgi:hypothetical protein